VAYNGANIMSQFVQANVLIKTADRAYHKWNKFTLISGIRSVALEAAGRQSRARQNQM